MYSKVCVHGEVLYRIDPPMMLISLY